MTLDFIDRIKSVSTVQLLLIFFSLALDVSFLGQNNVWPNTDASYVKLSDYVSRANIPAAAGTETAALRGAGGGTVTTFRPRPTRAHRTNSSCTRYRRQTANGRWLMEHTTDRMDGRRPPGNSAK